STNTHLPIPPTMLWYLDVEGSQDSLCGAHDIPEIAGDYSGPQGNHGSGKIDPLVGFLDGVEIGIDSFGGFLYGGNRRVGILKRKPGAQRKKRVGIRKDPRLVIGERMETRRILCHLDNIVLQVVPHLLGD